MYEVESYIQGFHGHRLVWTPYVEEHLVCVRKNSNSQDPFTVAVQKDGETFGHVLRMISCVCSLFLRQQNEDSPHIQN